MFFLKTEKEIDEAIEMMFQETDASKRIKCKHLIKNQFRQAFSKIESLERSNERLREEIEESPDFHQKQALSMISSYLKILG